MFGWVHCHFSGGHEYAVSCEPGAICLRCTLCGKRSSGWNLKGAPAPNHAGKRASAPSPRLPALSALMPFAGPRALR